MTQPNPSGLFSSLSRTPIISVVEYIIDSDSSSMNPSTDGYYPYQPNTIGPSPILDEIIHPPTRVMFENLITHSLLHQTSFSTPQEPPAPVYYYARSYQITNDSFIDLINSYLGEEPIRRERIKPLLDALPYSAIPKDVFKETTCSICLEDYIDGVNVVDLPCSHLFHQECITTWAKNHPECPLCRSAIPYEHEEMEIDTDVTSDSDSLPELVEDTNPPRNDGRRYYDIDYAEEIEEPSDFEVESQASSWS